MPDRNTGYLDSLRESFRHGRPVDGVPGKPRRTWGENYAIWRLLHAWRSQTSGLTPDLAVLLRQVARSRPEGLFTGPLPPMLRALASRAGVLELSGYINAEPFAPDWLEDDCLDHSLGVDPSPIHLRPSERLPGETYLSSLNFNEWNSLAQKEAAWASLTAPPGSTSLVALPTGSGKSLCFQLLSRFGSGLTVVIVPTVALAIDHWRSSRSVFSKLPDVNPCYYASDDMEFPPEHVIESIKNAKTRLVFTSPEACVSGRLRSVLEECAKSGALENLIVDEAHLIDTWGMYFRVDFQMLSILREKWLNWSRGKLRTFLLSATFTESCRKVLQNLYGTPGSWKEFVSQRLRPEIVYYRRVFDYEAERDEALHQCLWRLPRPAIFYTTEVEEARALHQQFGVEGFERIACFHGETKSSERRSILDKWRKDEIDIIVATSAFGLGVDKPDVRAVVHACLPEDLNRYYQEVGRGGRDGAQSSSLLLPTRQDFIVAKGLAPRLLGDEKLQERWNGLFSLSEAVPEDDAIYLRPDSKRMGLIGTRTGSENVRWNKRLILMLRRAGLLELLDLEYASPFEEDAGDELVERIKVRLFFTGLARDLAERLKVQRDLELAGIQNGIKQMEKYLENGRCTGTILRELYGPTMQRVCAGCRTCREIGRRPGHCPPLEFEQAPRTRPRHRLVAGCPCPDGAGGRAKLVGLIRHCITERGLRRFICSPEDHDRLHGIMSDALSRGTDLYRLDCLAEEASFIVQPEEDVAIFHLGNFHGTEKFFFGREVTHFISEGVNYLDGDGRYPFEQQGAILVPKYESWLREAR